MSIPVRIFAACVGLGLAAVTVEAIRARVAEADLVRVAALAEIGEVVSDEAIARASGDAAAMAREDRCGPFAVRAGTSVLMIGLDRSVGEDEAPGPEQLQEARAFLRHAVRCSPGDGNLWIRLALVEQALGAAADAQAGLITTAARLAPAEPATLAARIVFWVESDPETRRLARTALRSDLATLLAHAAPGDIVALLTNPPDDVQGDVLAVLARLDPQRRAALIAAGFDWFGDFDPDVTLRSGI